MTPLEIEREAARLPALLSADARIILECAAMLNGIGRSHGVPENLYIELIEARCMTPAGSGAYSVTDLGKATAAVITQRGRLVRRALRA